MKARARTCCWGEGLDARMMAYHHKEWGVPLHNDRKIFEFLVLEGMQAGLSWRTVLDKRENFRRAFRGFDPVKVNDLASGRCIQRVYECLVQHSYLRRPFALEPLLAASMPEVSPDTSTQRSGVK